MLNIVRCDSYDNLIKLDEEIWGGFPEVSGKKIFVKPNLCIPPTVWEIVSVTHPSVISIVLSKLKDGGASEIVVGCCGYKKQWEKTVRLGGYDEVCKRYGAKLVCVQEGENFHKYKMRRFASKAEYLSLFGMKVSEFALDSDFIINIPKLKVCYLPGFTCAIKNLMGIVSPKGSMHPRCSINTLMKRLRDFYFLMRPLVAWSLVDGIVGAEYAGNFGVPKNSGVLISGTDMWEVDCWATDVMGFDPEFFPYLRYIRKTLDCCWPARLKSEYRTEFELPLGWGKENVKAGYSGLQL